jgi:hypothetical protein
MKVGRAENEVDQADGKARQGKARQGKAFIGEVSYLDESCFRDVVQFDPYMASLQTFTQSARQEAHTRGQ